MRGSASKAPASTNRPRGRPRGDARERILGAARKLLAADRYDAVSVPEIVAAAGVAQGTFYLYFASKADLIDALTEMVQRAIETKVVGCLEQDKPLIAILALLLDAGAAVCREFADILPFLGSDGLLFGTSVRAEILRAPYLHRLAALIARDQEAGLLIQKIAPDHAARLVCATLDQVARDLARPQLSTSNQQYRDDAINFLTRALAPTSVPPRSKSVKAPNSRALERGGERD